MNTPISTASLNTTEAVPVPVPTSELTTRLIEYVRIQSMRADFYQSVEAQRRLIEAEGSSRSHVLVLRWFQARIKELEDALESFGPINARDDLMKLDAAVRITLSLEAQFGEVIDQDEEIGGVDAVDFIAGVLVNEVRPVLESLGLREPPFWTDAEAYGYRVHRGGDADALELQGLFWWSLYRPDWIECECSPKTFETHEAAWRDAVAAFETEVAAETPAVTDE